MNYPIPTAGSRSYTLLIRVAILLLLGFFVAYFMYEMVSFLKLFEAKTVVNPEVELLR